MTKYVDVTIPLSEDAIAWIAKKLGCSENEAHEKLEKVVKTECIDRMHWLTPILYDDNLSLIHVDETPDDEDDFFDGSVVG
jgi:hypothetical protein